MATSRHAAHFAGMGSPAGQKLRVGCVETVTGARRPAHGVGALEENEIMELAIYQIEAIIKGTAKTAAEDFARNFWDKPRKVIMTGQDTFRVSGGIREYKVTFQSGNTYNRPHIYQITVSTE